MIAGDRHDSTAPMPDESAGHPGARRRRTWLVLVACLVLAACGSNPGAAIVTTPSSVPAVSTPATANPEAQALTGYLAVATNAAVFLQWTRIGDTLSGSLTEAITTSIAAATPLQHVSDEFTGVVSGASVHLTFSMNGAWNGTLNGDQLVLSYAAADGTLQTLSFAPDTVADYNNAVTKLQAEVAQAQTNAAAASAALAQAQAQQQQLQQEQQAIDYAASAVQSDLQNVPQYLNSLQLAVKNVPQELTNEANEVQSTLAGEQSTASAAQQGVNSGEVCGDASEVGGDASEVGGGESEVEGGGSEIAAAINDVQGFEGQLQGHFQQLQQALAVLPSYQPGGLPTQSSVSTALSNANKVIVQAQRTYAGYLAQAKQMVATANGYAAAAQAVCTQAGG
ncbi:MAG: hypothetical protein ACHQ01_05645 [Candidatus Limnocylindrales bacterium]